MITIISLIYSIILFSVFSPDPLSSQTEDQITFTVIYDNTSISPEYRGDWGFACLIEGKDKTILFDTGTKPEVFKHNLEKLNIDLDKVDVIVISHNHGDHTGGLPVILEKRKDLSVYVPASVENDFLSKFPEFKGFSIGVNNSIELCKGATLTGEMGDQIKEHSLIIDTSKGLVVVCGCSHQGVENVIKKTKKLSKKQIYLVFGGFHMLEHSKKQVNQIIEEFKEAEVQYCGATHCTGDDVIKMFADAYGDHFVEMGSGRKIVIP
ncbi:MBL fold metallo-hydrolase [Bacteroidota bacterium]